MLGFFGITLLCLTNMTYYLLLITYLIALSALGSLLALGS